MSTRFTRRQFLRSALFASGLSSSALLVVACGGAGGTSGGAAAPEAGGATVNFELTADDTVDFSQEKLEAEAGSTISLTFKNQSTNKLFNWVLAQPGKMLRVVTDGAAEGEQNEYLRPNDENVIVKTKLLKPGESETITFNAPPPGQYPFFCTYPGYYTRMNGSLTIK